MQTRTHEAFFDEITKIALQLRFNDEQKKQMRDEVRDPRFYSNLRGLLSLESKKKRVENHKKLSPGVRDSKWQAAKEGFTRSKEAGIGSFLGGGLKGLGKVVTGKGVAGAAKAGGNIANMKNIWNAGAAKGGVSGFMGGLGALGRSGYGQMAAAAAVPVAAGYGLHKMTS